MKVFLGQVKNPGTAYLVLSNGGKEKNTTIFFSQFFLFPKGKAARIFFLTGICLDITIITDVLLKSKSWQMKILDDLNRLNGLPNVLEIVRRPTVWNREIKKYSNASEIDIGTYLYQVWHLQLATRNEHCWRSKGYNFRFIGQARVRDTLKRKKGTKWWRCRREKAKIIYRFSLLRSRNWFQLNKFERSLSTLL